MTATTVTHIRLMRCAGGYWGVLCAGRDAETGTHLGDVGARSRSYWRDYARRNDYRLIERE